MLPRDKRLTKNEVSFLMDKGEWHRSNLFGVVILKNRKPVNRFCIIIGKKLKLNPVKRNRLRRKIYEAIRKNLGLMDCIRTLDMAFSPRRIVIDKNFSEIEPEIIYILKNISKWAKTQ